MTNPTRESLEALAVELTDAQRQRLLDWPANGSTFHGEPDEIARQLCDLGIGVIMPWQPKWHGVPKDLRRMGAQMALSFGVGIPLHLCLRAHLKETRHD